MLHQNVQNKRSSREISDLVSRIKEEVIREIIDPLSSAQSEKVGDIVAALSRKYLDKDIPPAKAAGSIEKVKEVDSAAQRIARIKSFTIAQGKMRGCR